MFSRSRGNLRLEPPGRDRVVVNDLDERVQGRLGLERRPAGEHLVEDGPQRIDIGRGTDLLAPPACLFRGHVAGRSEDVAGHRRTRAAGDQLRQAEVDDLGLAVGRDQHVVRRQVTMDDPPLVRRLRGAGQRSCQLGRAPG